MNHSSRGRNTAPQELHTIWDFTDEFLVVCPRCSCMALVRPSAAAPPPRFTCGNCGSSRDWTRTSTGVLFSRSARDWPEGQYAIGDSADPYFHYPLWLQAPCGRHTLWAFNRRHLQFIHDYVAAKDRRRPPQQTKDPFNTLLASRLPRWMKLAKNRETVLRVIHILEAKLQGNG